MEEGEWRARTFQVVQCRCLAMVLKLMAYVAVEEDGFSTEQAEEELFCEFSERLHGITAVKMTAQ